MTLWLHLLVSGTELNSDIRRCGALVAATK